MITRPPGSAHVVARNVLRIRMERGLSQSELARIAGFGRADVSRIENARSGRRGLTLAKIDDLARALKIPVSHLFS